MHPRERRQLRRLARERDLDGLRAKVTQLGQRPLVDELAVSENPDSVAHRLHLAEDVRGEEDGLPALLGLLHAVPEGDLHQRVQAARRLVEQQQLRAGGERGDQLHLLAVALRQRPDLLVDVELEPLDEHVAISDVGAAV